LYNLSYNVIGPQVFSCDQTTLKFSCSGGLLFNKLQPAFAESYPHAVVCLLKGKAIHAHQQEHEPLEKNKSA